MILCYIFFSFLCFRIMWTIFFNSLWSWCIWGWRIYSLVLKFLSWICFKH